MAPRSRKSLFLWFVLVLGVLPVAGYFGGMAFLRARLDARVQSTALRLGLSVSFDDLEVGLDGTIAIVGLSFTGLSDGLLRGEIERIEAITSLGELLNGERPRAFTITGLTVEADADGLRALRRDRPAASDDETGVSSRTGDRIAIKGFVISYQIDADRRVNCAGQRLDAHVSTQMHVQASMRCQTGDGRFDSGPFVLTADNDPNLAPEPWQILLAPETSFRAELAQSSFGRISASLGAHQGRLEIADLAFVVEAIQSEQLAGPPAVHLTSLGVVVARADGDWAIDRVEAGPGTIRLPLSAAAESEDSTQTPGEADDEGLLLSEIEQEAGTVNGPAAEWDEIEADLIRLERVLQRGMELATRLANRVDLRGLDLVLAREGQEAESLARLERLTAREGHATATAFFGGHTFEIEVSRARAEDIEALRLSINAPDVDLDRLSESMGMPGLLTGQGSVSFETSTGAALDMRLAVSLTDLVFTHGAVSPEPLAFMPIETTVTARFTPTESEILHVEAVVRVGEVVSGGSTIIVREHRDENELVVDFRIDEAPCADLLAAVPEGTFVYMNPEGIRLRGRAGVDGSFRYVFGRPRSFRLEFDESFPGTCEIRRLPRGYRPSELLEPDFRHRVSDVYTTREVTVGPGGTEGYVEIEDLPDYVPAIMYLTEQAAFYEDPAISVRLITRAVRVNLIYGRWAYGGSTVTQQLVKNLFFDRDKTLARKFEEAFISWAVEQALTKDQILELYMNCIEFAPDVWGIQAGAEYYFGISATDLSPIQATWLAGLKPWPSSGPRHIRRGHSPTRGRWPRRFQERLQELVDAGLISQDYVDAQAPYVIPFGPPETITPLD
jgi:hypothetical protein